LLAPGARPRACPAHATDTLEGTKKSGISIKRKKKLLAKARESATTASKK
jgi:hypothetical protein